MGFFSDLFGGSDDSAQKAQLRQNREAITLAAEQADRARADVNRLFGRAVEAPAQGFQSALDVIRESAPAQQQLVSQGAQRARSTRRSGLGQIQNAILGLPVDFSQLDQSPIQTNNRFQDVSIPDVQLSQPQQQNNISQMLGGMRPEDLMRILGGL